MPIFLCPIVERYGSGHSNFAATLSASESSRAQPIEAACVPLERGVASVRTQNCAARALRRRFTQRPKRWPNEVFLMIEATMGAAPGVSVAGPKVPTPAQARLVTTPARFGPA